MASPEVASSSSSLFSTPQRKKASPSTPLMDFSPHLSPIAQVSKPSPHRPTSLTLSSRKISSLPGIAEESSPTDHSAVLSSPMRKADFDDHELSMQTLSLLDESTTRQKQLGQSLHSISLLTEDELSYSRYQSSANNSSIRKHVHIAQPHETPERGYKLNLSTVFEGSNHEELERTRRENRSLIEEIRQRYSSFASQSQEKASEPKKFDREETPRKKNVEEELRYSFHKATESEKEYFDATDYLADRHTDNTTATGTGRKKKDHIAFKEDEVYSSDDRRYHSSDESRRSRRSHSSSRSPRRSPSRSPANLPVGSFFALVLDRNQNPLLVPVASHADEVDIDEEDMDMTSEEDRGRYPSRTPPSSSSTYSTRSPPHSRSEYYRRKFDDSRDYNQELKRAKYEYDSLLEEEDPLLRSISYISRAPVATRHRSSNSNLPQHPHELPDSRERERLMSETHYMPIQHSTIPLPFEQMRRSSFAFPSDALGSTFHTDKSKIYSPSSYTLDPIHMIPRDGAEAPLPFTSDSTPTAQLLSDSHHHLGYWKSRILKRDLTSIMSSPAMKRFS